MRKGVLSIRMRVLELPCSSHAWNLSEFGPHWQGLTSETLRSSVLKFQKIQNHSEIVAALRGAVVR